MNFNDRPIDDETIMIMKPDLTLAYTQIDSTVVMNKEAIPETIIINDTRNKLSNNTDTSNSKKILLTIGLIILAIIIYILGNHLSNGASSDADTKATTADTTISEKSATIPPADEKKLIPSLIGKTQEYAEKSIVDNGFSLGNITYEYSDNLSKGLVISQSPKVDTSYEKNGKVDLVISQGQKVAQVIPQTRGNGNGNGKDYKKIKNNK